MKIFLKLAVLGFVAVVMLLVGFLLGGAFGFKRGATLEMLSAAVFVTTIQDKVDRQDVAAARECARTTLDIYADTLRANQSLGLKGRLNQVLAPYTVARDTENYRQLVAERYQADPPAVSKNAIGFFGYELVREPVPAHLLEETRPVGNPGPQSAPAPVSTRGTDSLPSGVTRQ